MKTKLYLLVLLCFIFSACKSEIAKQREVNQLYQDFLATKMPNEDFDLKVCTNCYSLHDVSNYEKKMGSYQINLTAKELVDLFLTCYSYTQYNNYNYGNFTWPAYTIQKSHMEDFITPVLNVLVL